MFSQFVCCWFWMYRSLRTRPITNIILRTREQILFIFILHYFSTPFLYNLFQESKAHFKNNRALKNKERCREPVEWENGIVDVREQKNETAKWALPISIRSTLHLTFFFHFILAFSRYCAHRAPYVLIL